MDLKRKNEIACEAVNSISRHEDEDASVRLGMLDILVTHIEQEKAAIQVRVLERLKSLQSAS